MTLFIKQSHKKSKQLNKCANCHYENMLGQQILIHQNVTFTRVSISKPLRVFFLKETC